MENSIKYAPPPQNLEHECSEKNQRIEYEYPICTPVRPRNLTYIEPLKNGLLEDYFRFAARPIFRGYVKFPGRRCHIHIPTRRKIRKVNWKCFHFVWKKALNKVQPPLEIHEATGCLVGVFSGIPKYISQRSPKKVMPVILKQQHTLLELGKKKSSYHPPETKAT